MRDILQGSSTHYHDGEFAYLVFHASVCCVYSVKAQWLLICTQSPPVVEILLWTIRARCARQTPCFVKLWLVTNNMRQMHVLWRQTVQLIWISGRSHSLLGVCRESETCNMWNTTIVYISGFQQFFAYCEDLHVCFWPLKGEIHWLKSF